MKLVQTTEVTAFKTDDFTAIKLIKEAGFDGYDYNLVRAYVDNNLLGTDKYLSHAKNVRKFADDLNIPCLQAHAPFCAIPDEQSANRYVQNTLRFIEVAQVVGCPIIVVHPANDFSAQQNYDLIYSKLLPLAKQANVKIATENMWNRIDDHNTTPAACGTEKDFIDHVDVANDEYLTACLDVGHAHMQGAPGAPALIRSLGQKRLGALHIHDNDLIHDKHVLPFHGKIKWEEIIIALKEIDYQGNFTFESEAFMLAYPIELLSIALKHMEQLGRFFIKKLTE